ncbi:MAG TPA: ArsR family transcriptional regulator [Thermoflexia bacterium]|jgi:predicted ArsR family transcriptional regulator|nr:ArsR family transcriptional regulator [Thermoflexia bacterium]
MQKTREQILRILKVRGAATVEELSRDLGLTPVTIRHHLDVLNREGLITPPEPFHRPGPGRPQYLYRLTEEASHLFPKHYDLLAAELLREIAQRLSPGEVEDLLDGIAQRLAQRAQIREDASFSERVNAAVQFLNEQGYMVSTDEDGEGGLILHIANCPFERVARDWLEPCKMDIRLLTWLLGEEPRRIASASAGDSHRCTYLLSPTGESG